jgi:hypothetical protein
MSLPAIMPPSLRSNHITHRSIIALSVNRRIIHPKSTCIHQQPESLKFETHEAMAAAIAFPGFLFTRR